jgi:hypothetical protein
MRTMLSVVIACLLLFPISAVGDIQTNTHTVKQSFGGSQSPDDARINATLKQASILAGEGNTLPGLRTGHSSMP